VKQVGSESKKLTALTQVGKGLSKGPHGLLAWRREFAASLRQDRSVALSQQEVPGFFTESGKQAIQPFHVEKRTPNNKATAESKDAFVRTETPQTVKSKLNPELCPKALKRLSLATGEFFFFNIAECDMMDKTIEATKRRKVIC